VLAAQAQATATGRPNPLARGYDPFSAENLFLYPPHHYDYESEEVKSVRSARERAKAREERALERRLNTLRSQIFKDSRLDPEEYNVLYFRG